MVERIECEHGSLKRKCLVCELQADLEAAKAENAILNRMVEAMAHDMSPVVLGYDSIYMREIIEAVEGTMIRYREQAEKSDKQ